MKKELGRNILARLYLKQGRSIPEIADILKSNYWLIRDRLIKFNIPIRSLSDSIKLTYRLKKRKLYIFPRCDQKKRLINLRKKMASSNYKQSMSKAKLGVRVSSITKKKISKAHIKRLSNPINKKKFLAYIFNGFSKLGSNKSEKLLAEILKDLFKADYKFVGNGAFIIESFNPDFICKKSNKIIELYGERWHSTPEALARDSRRLKAYRDHGYELLIVWYKELSNLVILKDKLLNFHKNKGKQIKK